MKTKKVLVVAFRKPGTPHQHYFMGVDEERVVFFSKLKIDSVQSSNSKEALHPMFIVYRHKECLDIGSCEWLNDGQGAFLALHGFNEIRKEAQQYDIEAHDHHFLKASWFADGDLIEIRKEAWGKVSWLSHVATSRQLGTRFHNVFPKGTMQWDLLFKDSHQLDLLFDNSKSVYKQLSQKKVIFKDQQPTISSLKEFY